MDDLYRLFNPGAGTGVRRVGGVVKQKNNLTILEGVTAVAPRHRPSLHYSYNHMSVMSRSLLSQALLVVRSWYMSTSWIFSSITT